MRVRDAEATRDLRTEKDRELISGNAMSFAIVVSDWHRDLTRRLEMGAIEALTDRDVSFDAIDVFHVPGSFELPVVCSKAALSFSYDAVIALGIVIRGDTPHFDYVAGETARGLMNVSLESGIPVMFGVITADTMQQAIDRCGEKSDNKGYEAAISAIETVHTLNQIDDYESDIPF